MGIVVARVPNLQSRDRNPCLIIERGLKIIGINMVGVSFHIHSYWLIDNKGFVGIEID